MIRHVAGIAEVVENVNASIEFYSKTLDIEVVDRKGDDYAVLKVAGIGHFALWNRAHAAESTFGTREDRARIPLGIHLEFEAESVDAVHARIKESGTRILQDPKIEPWGQKTLRILSSDGSFIGFAETPWARRLTQEPAFSKD